MCVSLAESHVDIKTKNMRKRSLLSFLFVGVLTLLCSGRTTMKQVFVTMPDSIFPYLTHNNRLDCVDFMESKMKAKFKNEFDETGELVALTQDYMKIRLNDNCTYEMKLFDVTEDTLQRIGLIRTYYGPEPESKIEFYSTNWERLDNSSIICMPSFDSFWQKPDTMSIEQLDSLRRLIDPVIFTSAFQEPSDTPTIVFQLSMPLLNKEDVDRIKCYTKSINIKWNGRIFK